MKIAKYISTRGYDINRNINLDYTFVSSIDVTTQIDSTNVATWSSLIKFIGKDYIYMRDFARTVFIPIWGTLSIVDKQMLAQYYLYPVGTTQTEIDSLIPVENQLVSWITLAQLSKDTRDIRWEVARQKVSFYLTDIQSLDLYKSTKEYSNEYRDANIPSLILWINNGSFPPLGIDFTTTGFAQKSYYTAGLRDLLTDIISNGNYSI